jgi:hypothetical protein
VHVNVPPVVVGVIVPAPVPASSVVTIENATAPPGGCVVTMTAVDVPHRNSVFAAPNDAIVGHVVAEF